MFLGAILHAIDDKGRLAVPQRFRYQLNEKFIITRGVGGCLLVMSEDQFRIGFHDKINKQPLFDRDVIKVQRFFCGEATPVAPDSQGRVAIPSSLREHAGIALQSDVVVVGLSTHLEIWSNDRWDAYNGSVSEDDLYASMDKVGIGHSQPPTPAEAPAG